MSKSSYERPEIKDLGSVRELTRQTMNKIGPSADILTAINQDIIGSFSPFG